MEESNVNPACEILLIGGSAGSLEVIFKLLPKIRTELAFPIVLVLHRRNSVDSSLAELLSTKTNAPTREIEDKEPIVPGTLYLAPADYHSLVESNRTFSLDYSEKVNFSRPSIDVTFESAAEIFGRNTVALLLSGSNEDGTQGLKAIRKAGGRTAVQDPATASMPFMPQSAINESVVDYVFDLEQMADFITNL